MTLWVGLQIAVALRCELGFVRYRLTDLPRNRWRWLFESRCLICVGDTQQNIDELCSLHTALKTSMSLLIHELIVSSLERTRSINVPSRWWFFDDSDKVLQILRRDLINAHYVRYDGRGLVACNFNLDELRWMSVKQPHGCTLLMYEDLAVAPLIPCSNNLIHVDAILFLVDIRLEWTWSSSKFLYWLAQGVEYECNSFTAWACRCMQDHVRAKDAAHDRRWSVGITWKSRFDTCRIKELWPGRMKVYTCESGH